jgi:hypothetical protein
MAGDGYHQKQALAGGRIGAGLPADASLPFVLAAAPGSLVAGDRTDSGGSGPASGARGKRCISFMVALA